MLTHAVYGALYKSNKDIEVNKMEEGLLSYNTPDTDCWAMKYAYRIRKIFGMKNMKDEIKHFYCFSKNAYNSNLSVITIPRIRKNDSKIRDVLNHVFLEKPLEPYCEKYIFLSCIYDIEGGEPIGEFELALKLAELIGKNNLIVKVHPRDNIKRYLESGLKVDKNSSIPWEVIQINQDFSEKVIITTLSGSILNFNHVLDKVNQSYYAYPLCKISKNKLAEHYANVLENYIKNSEIGLRGIKVLERLEDLVQ